jgi:C4-dicarboxylate transporter DctM subunit
MSIVGITLVVGVFFFLLIGVPIAFSLGLTCILAILVSDRIPLMVFTQRMFTAADSFPLMAIIFFVIAGELMLQGGISKRLVRVASAFLGWLRGSLAFISLVTCAFFGAISGSALATTAAIGGVMFPEMVERGYKDDFSATLQATGGTLGILIPPSIPLVIYGVLTGVSIGDLFIAVIPAGIIAMFLYMATAYTVVVKENMAPKEMNPEKVGKWDSLKDAIWGLMTPVIILGGIYSGIFTPTESAVVASIYAFFIGVFVYKELNKESFYKALGNSAVVSASIMIIIATATLFGWIMTAENIPVMVSKAIISLTDSKIVFLLLVNVIYIVAGMFMETSTIILLLVPLFLPVALQLGVSPLHFGIITVLNLSLGLITPPFGASLFVASGISKVPIDRIYYRVLPFILAGIVSIAVITYMPVFSVGFLNAIR